MQRLKTKQQFQAVLNGAVISKTEHFAMHGRRCPELLSPSQAAKDARQSRPAQVMQLSQGLWIAAMVPKRWAKRAVTRNAIKRQIYALSITCTEDWTHGAFLVRLRKDFSRKVFLSASSESLARAVRDELQSLFRVASSKLDRF